DYYCLIWHNNAWAF
nr:immunoglobulin light chain junction region [Macaca mulatta]MOX31344.1 immunoglobulin light chain junction region [Macaca mulatta]